MSEEKSLTPQEKYLNHYVDILKQTLNQQILNGVSLQASAKVNGDILTEWQKENESLKQQLAEINSQGLVAQEDLKKQIEQLKSNAVASQSAREQQQNAEIEKLKSSLNGKDDLIKNITATKDDIIKGLQTEISRLGLISVEHEKIKHQVGQIDVFRSELIKHQKLVQDKDNEIQNVISQKDNELQNVLNEKNATIDELNQQIEYLKLTPAKRKKLEAQSNPLPLIEEVKPEETLVEAINLVTDFSSQEDSPLEETDDTIKDGGSF
jgi:chromosome segregation ATPase